MVLEWRIVEHILKSFEVVLVYSRIVLRWLHDYDRYSGVIFETEGGVIKDSVRKSDSVLA